MQQQQQKTQLWLMANRGIIIIDHACSRLKWWTALPHLMTSTPSQGEQPLNDFVQRINELYSRDV